MNLEFLKSHFMSRIISNTTDILWPLKSYDCNPPDFFFWEHLMSHVFRCKPKILDQIKGLVADFATNISKDLIRKVCGSTRDRFIL